VGVSSVTMAVEHSIDQAEKNREFVRRLLRNRELQLAVQLEMIITILEEGGD
jgi:hypothetical protein